MGYTVCAMTGDPVVVVSFEPPYSSGDVTGANASAASILADLLAEQPPHAFILVDFSKIEIDFVEVVRGIAAAEESLGGAEYIEMLVVGTPAMVASLPDDLYNAVAVFASMDEALNYAHYRLDAA